MSRSLKKIVLLTMLVIFLAVQTGCEGDETDRTDTMLGGVLAGALVISQAGSIIKRSTDTTLAESNVVKVTDTDSNTGGSGDSSDGSGSDGSSSSGGDSGDETLPIPANPTPPDQKTDMGNEIKLSWEVEDFAFGEHIFDLYLGTSPETLKIISKGQYSREYTAYRLTDATRYYWKVLVRNLQEKQTEGPTWRFDTIGYVAPEENVAPIKPYDPVPQSDSDYQPLTMTLTWQGGDDNATDLVKYDLYFSASAPPTALAAEKTTETSFKIENLAKNQTYYWKVVSTDSSGLVTEGDVWSFTTGNGSKAKLPTNPTPSDNKVFTDELPAQLTWTGGSTDDSEVKYNVYFGDKENELNLNQDITQTSFSLTGITYEKTYYWRVQAIDEADIPVTGPMWNFTTRKTMTGETGGTGDTGTTDPNDPNSGTGDSSDNSGKEPPALIEPANNSVDMPLEVTLTWEAEEFDKDDVTTFAIFLGKEPTTVPSFHAYNLSSVRAKNLEPNTKYYWKIEYYNQEEVYDTDTPYWTFTTASEEPEPASSNAQEIDFYYTEGCPYCQQELSFLEAFEAASFGAYKVNKYNLDEGRENLEKFQNLKNTVPGYDNEDSVPVTVIGDQYMVGYSQDTGPGKIIEMLKANQGD